MDTVFIQALSVKGRHGVGEEERRVEQEFIVDIEARFDATEAARSDALADTVDYCALRDTARRIVERTSYLLIEKLAAHIAEEIVKDARIARVAVTIRKPAVWDNGMPGVTVERSRI